MIKLVNFLNKSCLKIIACLFLVSHFIVLEDVLAESTEILSTDKKTTAPCECPIAANNNKFKKVKGVSKTNSKAESSAENAALHNGLSDFDEWTVACSPKIPDTEGKSPKKTKVCPKTEADGVTSVFVCFDFPCKK